MRAVVFVFFLVILPIELPLQAVEPVPAFPGAEGHGALSRGGRSGRVVHVTNLKKRGPGSLDWAINEVKEPRTIVFDVSGVIDCNDEISFAVKPGNDHVTIAGETSPHGVAVYNYRRFDISGEDIILRHLRFRGTRIHTKNDPDCLLISNARNVIVDHCSFAGACDETIDTSRSENVTVQWTGIDASRKAEAHADFFDNNGQWHNYGSLHARSKRITIHHCLYAHQSKRCPLTDAESDVEAINNVVYNYSNTQQTWGAEGPGLTIVNCVFKLGPDRRKNAVPVKPDAKVIRGCVSREADNQPGPPALDQGPEPKLSLSRIDTAEDAYIRVLQFAGALPHDATSKLMIEDTRQGTGRQGYEDRIVEDRKCLEKPAPTRIDSDQDGLPDEWEIARRLDPNNDREATSIGTDGYTELEHYCHHLAAQRIQMAQGGDAPIELGRLSAKYESGNRGPDMVSTGKGDPGGVSYGTYQLASALGNADRFVQKYYPNEFQGLKGGTPEFSKVWKETVAKDPPAFHRNEHAFIKQTHYDPQVALIARETGVDANQRSPAFRDVVWSCAVHHGPRSKIIVLTHQPGISDLDWIKAVYAERGRKDDQGKLVYFQRVGEQLIPSLTNRFRNELNDALKMLAAQ